MGDIYLTSQISNFQTRLGGFFNGCIMKLATIDRDIQSNLGASSAFTINNNSKMFSILADKIYTDKPLAVVREICCNALDANPTGQFWISLPSRLEPMLSIRDFGPGMSHHAMMTIYSSFFTSTKDKDDDAIGGFGLGCKSPFAYTDAFTVVSIQNGVKRVYAAFKGDGNVPQIVLAETVDTDEPDGLEVRVPIQTADEQRFRTAAQQVLQWFPEDSYKCFGMDIVRPDISLRTDKYLVLSKFPPQAKTLMGPVAYDLNWPDADLPRTIVPIFQIGELDLPPSRESLSYDPQTIAALKERRREIMIDICEVSRAQAIKMQPWERLEFLAKQQNAGLLSLFNGWRQIKGYTDKDEALAKAWSSENNRPSWEFNGKVWGRMIERKYETIKINTEVSIYEYNQWGRKQGYKLKEKPQRELMLTINYDDKQYMSSKIFFDDTDGKRIYARFQAANVCSNIIVVKGGTIEALNKLIAPKVAEPLSSLPLPGATPRVSGSTKIYRYNFYNRADYAIGVTDTAPPSGYWVPFNGNEPEMPVPIWQYLQTGLVKNSHVVVGLTKKARALSKNYTPLQDLINTGLAEMKADKDIFKAIQFQKFCEAMNEDPMFQYLTGSQVVRKMFPSFGKKYEELSILLKAKELPRYLMAIEYGLLDAPKPCDFPALTNELKKISANHPRLVEAVTISRRDPHNIMRNADFIGLLL